MHQCLVDEAVPVTKEQEAENQTSEDGDGSFSVKIIFSPPFLSLGTALPALLYNCVWIGWVG